MPMKARKKATAAASLHRLSPSTSRVSRSGAPTLRKIEITATGSVVATTEASSRQATSGSPATGQSAIPMPKIATTTATMARRRIGTASSRRR